MGVWENLFKNGKGYEKYKFESKYGEHDESTRPQLLLEEFNNKLEQCCKKIKESGGAEIEAEYRNQGKQLKELLEASLQAEERTKNRLDAGPNDVAKYRLIIDENMEVLARSIDIMDDMLKGEVNDEHNKQAGLLSEKLQHDAARAKMGVAISAFLVATMLVVACVFAVQTGGMSFLMLSSVGSAATSPDLFDRITRSETATKGMNKFVEVKQELSELKLPDGKSAPGPSADENKAPTLK